MLRWFLLTLCLCTLIVEGALAQETSDSLRGPDSLEVVKTSYDTIYVIPAGPVAGGFTDASRIQVVDTVAGWAKILVEGWVPVGKVVARMSSDTGLLKLTDIEKQKPKKQKPERPQCAAMTGKGNQCSRKAITGSRYCWQHSQ